MKISVDVDEMINRANIIEEIAEELQINMHNIEKLILDLGFEWQGNAELAYTAKLLFIKKQFEILYSFIIEYMQIIYSIVNDYENIENELLSKWEV